MKKIILFLMVLLAVMPQVFACSIAPYEIPFCQMAEWYPETTIARGKILEKIEHGIRLELYEIYRGSETQSEVILWDKENFDCNGTIFDYSTEHIGEVGETILLLMQPITTAESTWEQPGDYRNLYSRIDGLGLLAKPMVQNGDKMKGLFAEGVDSIDLDELAEKLSDCATGILTPPRVVGGIIGLDIYPNPSQNYLFVENEISPESEIQIFDLSGRLVMKQDSYAVEAGIRINLLPEGMYIISVKSEGLTMQEKFLVNR
ncbi:MAG: T9SS type A sorting domain-containing protein [Bacteroidia bacterium]|nr:T9SS type A sorting domain-containing protein [Bacteroidia bacterium]